MDMEEKAPSHDDLAWVSRELQSEHLDLEADRRDWETRQQEKGDNGVEDNGVEDEPPNVGCFYHNMGIITKHVANLRILRIKGMPDGERVGFVLYRDRETSDTTCDMLWIHPEHRDQGYATQFIREIHFRVLCAGGSVRYIHAVKGTEDFWARLGYRVISRLGSSGDVRMITVLSPEDYTVVRGWMEVGRETGTTFDKDTDGPELLAALQKSHTCEELLRTEGGIQFPDGGQIRYRGDHFVIKEMKLGQLLKVILDMRRAGLHSNFRYRESEYCHADKSD